jgi:hypothetical protein
MTPAHTLLAARGALLLAIGGLAVLMFGPFQGLEAELGLSDKAAHGLAFYGLTVGLFATAPRLRRGDLVWVALLLASGSELLQSAVGRDGDMLDLAADAAGVMAAWLPQLAADFRWKCRTYPDLTFDQIQQFDRRRGRRRLAKTSIGALQALEA